MTALIGTDRPPLMRQVVNTNRPGGQEGRKRMRGQEEIRKRAEMGYGGSDVDEAAVAGFMAEAESAKVPVEKIADLLYGMLVAGEAAKGTSLKTMAETVDRLDAMWQGSYAVRARR